MRESGVSSIINVGKHELPSIFLSLPSLSPGRLKLYLTGAAVISPGVDEAASDLLPVSRYSLYSDMVATVDGSAGPKINQPSARLLQGTK